MVPYLLSAVVWKPAKQQDQEGSIEQTPVQLAQLTINISNPALSWEDAAELSKRKAICNPPRVMAKDKGIWVSTDGRIQT